MVRNIIVSGIPASGKSTIGRLIATSQDLEMLDKDEILEMLFETKGIGDVQWRTRLSRNADELLCERALGAGGAVIVSWWRHPKSTVASGTPIDWLAKLPGTLIEIHCTCNPRIATDRFKTRQRHEGHLDRFKPYADLLSSFQQHAALGPLGIGHLIMVNTDTEPDIQKLLGQIDNLMSL
jgi:hypothetical protein